MAILRWFWVYLFVLDIPPEPLYKNIVDCSALTIHAEPGVLKALNIPCKNRAGKLAPLVGVNDFGGAMRLYGHLEAFLAPFRCHGVRQGPTNDEPAKKVYDGHQVHVASTHGNISDIHSPGLIGAYYGYPSQQVRINGMPIPFVRFACIGPWPDGVQVHLPIEPPYPLRVHLMPVFPQVLNHAGNAIKRRLGVLFVN